MRFLAVERFHLIDFAEDSARALQKDLALRGRHHAARRAFKQGNAQRPLEIPDGPAQVGLVHI